MKVDIKIFFNFYKSMINNLGGVYRKSLKT